MTAGDAVDRLSQDPWVSHMANYYPPDKLHALGVVTFLWSICETDIVALFEQITGIKGTVSWVLTRDMSAAAICQRVREIARYDRDRLALADDFLTRLEHVLTAFDQCRQNRNRLTHFAIGANQGQLTLEKRDRKNPGSVLIPETLEDIRTVADDIERVHRDLLVLSLRLDAANGV